MRHLLFAAAIIAVAFVASSCGSGLPPTANEGERAGTVHEGKAELDGPACNEAPADGEAQATLDRIASEITTLLSVGGP